jgi:hypothetical protein
MSLPDLPVDVLITVSEFLAGAHAFGTIAALNQASHATREGTTPLLYETIFLDKVDETAFFRDIEKSRRSEASLQRFRYTKLVHHLLRHFGHSSLSLSGSVSARLKTEH